MKKFKFPLIMKNGAEVRDIEQLRENFDIESILQYYSNGKLRRWLENNYYDDIFNAVEMLNPESLDFGERLAQVLGAEWHNTEKTNLRELIRTARLKEQMKPFISEEELEKIKYIADSQMELERLVKTGHTLIYLFGEKFTIKEWMERIDCIGVNNPVVYLEIQEKESSFKEYETYQKKKIRLREVKFANNRMEIVAQGGLDISFKLLDLQRRYLEEYKADIAKLKRL